MSSIQIDEVIRPVANLPDRDSPQDQREMMLVSGDVLREILEEQLAALVAPVQEPAGWRDFHSLWLKPASAIQVLVMIYIT